MLLTVDHGERGAIGEAVRRLRTPKSSDSSGISPGSGPPMDIGGCGRYYGGSVA
jgi:hypothetical protein